MNELDKEVSEQASTEMADAEGDVADVMQELDAAIAKGAEAARQVRAKQADQPAESDPSVEEA